MNSSPEEFQLYQPEVVQGSGFIAGDQDAAVPAFQVADALWSTLMTDPGLKAELDRLIETRIGHEIRARVQVGESELRESTVRQAREDGLALGREEAHAEAELLRGTVEEVCRRVLDAGHRQLDRHETIWMESLSRLMKRFLVRNDTEVAQRIRVWLREGLEGIKDKDEVSVYLSTKEFERLAGNLGPSGKGWRWMVDPTLADGEVRCETDMGGALFSPGEQLTRLEHIVEECSGEVKRGIGKP